MQFQKDEHAANTASVVDRQDSSIADNALLQSLLEADLDSNSHTDRERPTQKSGVIIGEFVGVNDRNEPLVKYTEFAVPSPQIARSVLKWTKHDIGRQVVIMFERGDFSKPIIMGFLQTSQSAETTDSLQGLTTPVDVEANVEQIHVNAEKEIVLRCGEASITLTRAGKVIIRGNYLLSRSTGTNRIKGGSIQLN